MSESKANPITQKARDRLTREEIRDRLSPRIKLLSMADVVAATGEARTTIHEKVKRAKFPCPVKIGKRLRGGRARSSPISIGSKRRPKTGYEGIT